MHEVASLATLRRQELEEDDTNFSSAQTSTFVQDTTSLSASVSSSLTQVQPSTLLEYPYCVEVSFPVIKMLIALLKGFMEDLNSSPTEKRRCEEKKEAERRVLSVLQILDTQFYALCKSKVHPREVGLADPEEVDETSTGIEGLAGTAMHKANTGIHSGNGNSASHAKAGEFPVAKFMQNASQVVKSLFDSGISQRFPQISKEAEKVFSRGSMVFLPDLIQKVDFAVSVAKERKNMMSHSNGTGDSCDSSCKNSNSAWANSELLTILVKQMSSTSSVLNMINAFSPRDGTTTEVKAADCKEKKLFDFIKMLLELLALPVHSKAAEGEVFGDLAEENMGLRELLSSAKLLLSALPRGSDSHNRLY